MSKITVQIYAADNDEFSFRVKGGNARITLTPGETYKTRGSVRRALRTLAKWAMPAGLGITPLFEACHEELDREQAAWNARRRAGRAS